MPEISRFFGILIRMYYDDHAPPHFHAKHGGDEIKVYLESGAIEGRFPSRPLRQVLEWYDLHRAELQEDWQLAAQRKPLKPIAPLE
jgi:hypothetical protein